MKVPEQTKNHCIGFRKKFVPQKQSIFNQGIFDTCALYYYQEYIGLGG